MLRRHRTPVYNPTNRAADGGFATPGRIGPRRDLPPTPCLPGARTPGRAARTPVGTTAARPRA
ncbi:hypothetical protein GCM10023224_06400 [Streptomonospora halophila]|uniref:Uncharacterized protein n=1 Tax=Streptomonospora halophila TaxID=427369 RepID=A0ABP9G5M6_9ACTN